MRSIDVRVEPTVRLVTDALTDELLIMLNLLIELKAQFDILDVFGWRGTQEI